MIIWIVFAVLTICAVLAALVPMLRKRDTDAPPSAHDLAVYKDQLAEIDRDFERGTIEKTEADAARTEISRRILNASARCEQEGRARTGAINKWGIVAVIVLIPAMAAAIYANFGRPDLPDMPLSARITAPQDQQDLSVLVAQVEKHLQANPDDGQGWEVLAPVYLRTNAPDKAVVAFRNVVRLLGPTEPRLSSLGEALVVSSQGAVTDAAQRAFEEARRSDPDAIKPRFFLALGLGQQGKKDEAVKAWNDLLADAEGGEAWIGAARSELQRLGADDEIASQTGPDKDDVEAISQMAPAEQQEMIVAMVEGLDERLKSEGGSVQQWLRLINAQMVLKRKDAAQDAVNRALTAYSGDQAATEQIQSVARNAGLDLP
ncbi:MAG: c-type cytochrome biogenesis protein CcmI [Stappiaceae bacterium]